MNQKANNSVRTVLTQRWINPENILSAPLKQNVKPCTQEGKFKNRYISYSMCIFIYFFRIDDAVQHGNSQTTGKSFCYKT